uniref:Uncharacterized protein n=1 Tax=Romanomermis culicivorax TaxID=13658 RepID=A0A915L042_ROMCU
MDRRSAGCGGDRRLKLRLRDLHIFEKDGFLNEIGNDVFDCSKWFGVFENYFRSSCYLLMKKLHLSTGIRQADNHRRMAKTCGDTSPSYVTVKNRATDFKRGCQLIENQVRAGVWK